MVLDRRPASREAAQGLLQSSPLSLPLVALSVLTARHLDPDVTIVAAATNRENVEKLRRAGADTVISPATIGSHLLVESAFGRGDTEEVARQLVEEPLDDDPS